MIGYLSTKDIEGVYMNIITEMEIIQKVLHSEFSIERHKEAFKNYLEVVIDEDGTVMYAVPSHQEKMIEIACKKLKVTRDELKNMCPEEYYLDFILWLSKVSSSCSVWINYVIGHSFTEKQINKLQELQNEGLYWGAIPKTKV